MIVKQEILRKQGFAIQVDEEQLRVQLEALQTELNHPTQFKVCNLTYNSIHFYGPGQTVQTKIEAAYWGI